MAKFFEVALIHLIISLFLITFSLSKPLHLITSCLIDHHVTNFSVHPTTPNQSNSTSYYNLLLFSLQNLRFTEPEYPKPSLIILPQSKEQLVDSFLCSKNAGFEARIRCGGHSYEGLSSTSNDGKPFVIIDVMDLDQVVMDLKLETAWVEGGATMGQVYLTVAEKTQGAYGFSGGSCPTVGSGGLISGGGFGFLSRKYGLAADNVVDALLVGPDGRVLDRAAMGEDVFWAVRGGGGGSFGIVYAWKIKLLNVPSRVTAFQVSREGKIENISQLVHEWQHVGPYLDDTFYLSISLSAIEKEKDNISATFNGLYLGKKFEAISIVNKKFPRLRIREDRYKEMSWIESVLYFSGLSEGSTVKDLRNRYLQNKNYFKAKSDYVRTAIPLEGIKGAMDFLTKEPKGMIIMDPYGGQMARIASDSIAFPHRKGNLYSIQYLVSWEKKDDKNRDLYLTWIRKFYDFMAPFVSANPRAAYVNYLDLDLGGLNDSVVGPRRGAYDAVEKGRIWGEKYFLGNYDRLVKAKTLIDPCNLFRHAQGIPPNRSRFPKVCIDADMHPFVSL
ncbi:hypothetical protein Cgig2_011195 [Carnegiea gigantea]|uniref:FAD-binding PCMH-type domain-containing protein n=1 Tax=Carnegiea gigantea TaxID=171969 RepID=A0A9Q1QHE4_9CARY|nr:hypothetical protein Cgig2_011195 [Carnegiea gigantea]